MGRIISGQRSLGDAGYFRIGNVILDVPPEQIQCHKVLNNSEVQPMRFPFALQVKTGQSRWDVTWSWKAILDPTQQNPYNEWEIVRLLLAMFKAAPFVEVENAHLRQIVNPGDLTPGASNSDVMAFALRQMRIDTVPDLVDTLQVTMTMSLFNYRPYTANFEYSDNSGASVPTAVESPLFNNYLQAWINTNLNKDPTQYLDNDTKSSDFIWETQIPGSITLTCREYRPAALPRSLNPPQGNATPKQANSSGSSQGNESADFVDNAFIQPVDQSNPDIQWWIQSVAAPESGGNYTAVNKSTVTNSGAPSVAVGICQWVRASALDAMTYSDKQLGTQYISIASQAGYIVKSTKKSSGYTWGVKQVPNPQSLADPTAITYYSWMTNPPNSIPGGATQLQNDMATAWALLQLGANGGSVLKAWEAHRFGQGVVNKGQGDPDQDNKWFNKAAGVWRSPAHAGHSQDFLPAANNTPAQQPVPPAPSTVATSGTDTNATVNTSNTSNPIASYPMTPQIRYLMRQGWLMDYVTENVAFLYKEHWLRMANQEANPPDTPACSDIPAQEIDVNHFVYPNQISVIFVNNIAQMPLASYQYPTYQHLGPVSTMVSIGMLSVAALQPATDIYKEPQHTGLNFISSMTNMMENQFQRLRQEWRRVNSIHRMQSYVVKNQILNMLGIHGMLVKEFTTETVPDSPNVVNAQLNAVQYENVYAAEEPSPFKVTAVPQQINQAWLQTLRDGTLDSSLPNSPFYNNSQVTALCNLSKNMRNPLSADAQSVLYDWLTKTVPGHLPDYSAYLVPTPSAFTSLEMEKMYDLMFEESSEEDVYSAQGAGYTNTDSFNSLYPDIAKQIQTHSALNYTDYFLIKNGTVGAQDYSGFATNMVPAIDARIAAASTTTYPVPNGGFEAPINQLWDLYADWVVSNNAFSIRDQMVQVMNSPVTLSDGTKLKDRFLTPDGKVKPGSLQVNQDHGCYVDMGIHDLTIGGRDYTPAYYFYDDNAWYTGIMNAQVAQVAKATSDSAIALENATPIVDTSYKISSSTESFIGTVQPILNLTHPSAYTMTKAFPTFKLFLMEDHSDRPFFAYDNFYSFATVLDIEIIRYRTKPDTAVIQISNLMHLLDQHLYDDTPQGRFEKSLRARTDTNVAPGEALIGAPGTGGVTLNSAPGGEIITLDNRFTEIQNYNSGSDPKFPLKYFALQTGTKIQVRMGFSNNPDLLVPVFTGQVTQLEGDEILTITAQSYMLELIQPTSDDLLHDGFSVDAFIYQGANWFAKVDRDINNKNLMHLPKSLLSVFGNTPAYGGIANVGGVTVSGILTPGGTAKDVMAAMLATSNAKHFGRWQYGAPTDRYMQGYKWQNALASTIITLSTSPLSKGASGMEAGYDRSYENLLTTHLFGPDGTATADADGGKRGWYFEKPGGYGAAEYHVRKDPSLTPWTLIQDIARRFPEFILTVKQYGFPFTADATLVFGNPHDLYTTRVPQPLEQEMQQQASSDNKLFAQWWFLGSASGRAQMQTFTLNLGGEWSGAVLYDFDNAINQDPLHQTLAKVDPSAQGAGDSAVSTLGRIGTFLGGLNTGGANTMRQVVSDELLAHIDGGGVGTFFEMVNLFTKCISGGIQSSTTNTIIARLKQLGGNQLFSATDPASANSALQQIVNNYYTFIKQQQSSPSPISLNDRMKPIRRYHLVNGDSIIHNGITLNGDFYNVVRLHDQQLLASEGLPNNYTRVLDANPFIVSQDNLDGWPEAQSTYMQTFLRDEVAKMYRGELVLLGNPEIEPYDMIILLDPSTGVSGPIEVDSVIHSFNQENGYITIVKPRAVVIINDKLSMSMAMAQQGMLNDLQNVIDGGTSYLGLSGGEKTVYGGVAEGLAISGIIAGGPWVAAAAVVAGSQALFWAGKEWQRMNPLGLAPLTRYERPWVAGVEGWQNCNLMQFFQLKWNYFIAQEWEPLVDSFRTARGMQII